MSDIWSHDEDLILAEAVLRYIREGISVIDAFDEVGKKLNRSAATCGYRWNSVVRHSYRNAIQTAREEKYRLR